MHKTIKLTGFTLIEIIVVLIILGILAALAFPAYFAWINKSRAAEAYVSIGAYLREANACYQRTGVVAQCLQPNTVSGNFTYTYSDYTGNLGITTCLEIVAFTPEPNTTPLVTLTCTCRNYTHTTMNHWSPVGKTIDFSTGIVRDCTANGGIYQGM